MTTTTPIASAPSAPAEPNAPLTLNEAEDAVAPHEARIRRLLTEGEGEGVADQRC